MGHYRLRADIRWIPYMTWRFQNCSDLHYKDQKNDASVRPGWYVPLGHMYTMSGEHLTEAKRAQRPAEIVPRFRNNRCCICIAQLLRFWPCRCQAPGESQPCSLWPTKNLSRPAERRDTHQCIFKVPSGVMFGCDCLIRCCGAEATRMGLFVVRALTALTGAQRVELRVRKC